MRARHFTIEQVRQHLSFDQPLLSAVDGDKFIKVTGTFLISPAAGNEYAEAFDRFEISVMIPKNFPRSEPLVFETGDRIPRIMDRHCYMSGACCTGIYEEWIATKPNRTIGEFFEGPVRNFFLSQIYFENHGTWPFGERTHGSEGIVEACADLLGIVKDQKIAFRYLIVLSGAWPKGHWLCPCGKGNIIKHCHLDELIAMHKKLPSHLAKRLLKHLVPKK